ncbi:MAG: hypothetical protein F4Z04_03705 [Acidobacteria bacterium]|nr:hypothetical protein [Acidobacteriota bacterium]
MHRRCAADSTRRSRRPRRGQSAPCPAPCAGRTSRRPFPVRPARAHPRPGPAGCPLLRRRRPLR